jgi:hypothetical protein
MLGSLHGLLIQEIEPKRIFPRLDLTEQSVAKEHPGVRSFLLAYLAFENALLHPHAVVLAGLGHASESAFSGVFDGGDIVGDQNQHRDGFYLGMRGM